VKTLLSPIWEFFRKGDLLLLSLCLLASGYGLALIYSATRWTESNRFVIVQGAAICLGVVAYVVLTFVDFRLFVDKCWKMNFCWEILFILLVLTPLGHEVDGNRNWLKLHDSLPLIQPDEIVKLSLILRLAWQMSRIHEKEEDISSIPSVFWMGGHLMILLGVVAAVCGDMGMCVIYICIFIIMTWCGGVKLRWYLGIGSPLGGGVVALWNFVLPKTRFWTDYRIMRFRVVFDHDLSPLDKGFQQTRSLLAIGSGQLTGQGFLNGTQTQSSFSESLPARHTDFIFSVCGEELGMIGCIALFGILFLIVLRCFTIAKQADSLFSAYVAVGVAGMLIAQIGFNVGMCLYVAPVMGLTLPFISYGGSSIVTMFAAMGIVSSVKAQTLPSWLKDRSKI